MFVQNLLFDMFHTSGVASAKKRFNVEKGKRDRLQNKRVDYRY